MPKNDGKKERKRKAPFGEQPQKDGNLIFCTVH